MTDYSDDKHRYEGLSLLQRKAAEAEEDGDIVNPLIRFLSVSSGFFPLSFGISAFIDKSFIIGFSLVAAGSTLIFFGFAGKRKRIGSVVQKSDRFGDIDKNKGLQGAEGGGS